MAEELDALLAEIFSSADLERLATRYSPKLAREISFTNPRARVAFDLVEKLKQQGVPRQIVRRPGHRGMPSPSRRNPSRRGTLPAQRHERPRRIEAPSNVIATYRTRMLERYGRVGSSIPNFAEDDNS